MNSVEAIEFAIKRLEIDRNHFVHTEQHNAALATLKALRIVLIEHQGGQP